MTRCETKSKLCDNLEVDKTTNGLGSSKCDQLVLKCKENALPVTSSKYELVLRLMHYDISIERRLTVFQLLLLQPLLLIFFLLLHLTKVLQ